MTEFTTSQNIFKDWTSPEQAKESQIRIYLVFLPHWDYFNFFLKNFSFFAKRNHFLC